MLFTLYDTTVWLSERNAGVLGMYGTANGLSENATAGHACLCHLPSSVGDLDGGMPCGHLWDFVISMVPSHRSGWHHEHSHCESSTELWGNSTAELLPSLFL